MTDQPQTTLCHCGIIGEDGPAICPTHGRWGYEDGTGNIVHFQKPAPQTTDWNRECVICGYKWRDDGNVDCPSCGPNSPLLKSETSEVGIPTWKSQRTELGREIDAWAERIQNDALEAAAKLAEAYFDPDKGDTVAEASVAARIASAIRRLKHE